MAAAEERSTTYPKIPVGNWWKLRAALKQKYSGVTVDDATLATILETQRKAAGNLRPQLVRIGLVDPDGGLTARALDWRGDEGYADVCQTMLDELYPPALLAVCPPPSPDRSRLVSWFTNNAGDGVGEGAARQMAGFYQLLCRQDPAEGVPGSANGRKLARASAKAERPPKLPAQATRAVVSKQAAGARVAPPQGVSVHRATPPAPAVSVAVQIYITAEASADQIDQVFASMAKHIYGAEAQGDGR